MEALIELLRTDDAAQKHVEIGLLDFTRRLVTGKIDQEYVSTTRPFMAAELTCCVGRIIAALEAKYK